MVKIAHVSPYDHSVSGGVGEHVKNLCRHHRALGHDAWIIAPASDPAGLGPEVLCVSTKVTAIPGSGSVARLCLSPPAFRRVGRILDAGRFDVVHVHEPLAPMVSLAAARHGGTVTVGTIHGYRPRFFLYRLLRSPLGRVLDGLSVRVAVSTDAERWINRYFPGEYHVIPDGVDVERFAADVAPVKPYDDDRPTVLFVGRLEPRKGFPHLLDAFGQVKRRLPAARLLVVGHYPDTDRERWEREAHGRGISDVVFVGYVSDDDLPAWYQTADVFCAPSTGYEALGIVLLEAMAAGTPVVTTEIEGYRTVVTHRQDALVVPPADADALASALEEVLVDPGLRAQLVENGRQRVDGYAWPRIARRLLDLYASCAAGDRAPSQPPGTASDTYEQLYATVAGVLEQTLLVARDRIDPQTSLASLELDSLDLAELSILVEQHTGLVVGDEDLVHVRTVADVVDLLAAKEQHGQP
jgi:phosphatidyl-myo-inositol alpha-mannosyltransferase